jgi:glycosyltransferase involved in cell wall biosynthesis
MGRLDEDQSSIHASNLWIIIPAYCEQQVVATFVSELRKVYSKIIVVDDGSLDETATRAMAAGPTALVHAVNLGQRAAFRPESTLPLTVNRFLNPM